MQYLTLAGENSLKHKDARGAATRVQASAARQRAPRAAAWLLKKQLTIISDFVGLRFSCQGF
jgi:hypothetical protein